jgi:5-methylcytosine-specific restriction endonuclease McrA
MKHCRWCGITKQKEDFYKRLASPDGLSHKCKVCTQAYHKAHYAANPEPAKERARKWANANRVRRHEIQRKYHDTHLERMREKGRNYQRRIRAERPEEFAIKNRANVHTRRQREAGRMNPGFVAELFQKAGGMCVYCGKAAVLTVDHMTAVVNGGTNENDNLFPCCKSCNSSKQNADMADWLERRFGATGLGRAVAFLEGNSVWKKLCES